MKAKETSEGIKKDSQRLLRYKSVLKVLRSQNTSPDMRESVKEAAWEGVEESGQDL